MHHAQCPDFVGMPICQPPFSSDSVVICRRANLTSGKKVCHQDPSSSVDQHSVTLVSLTDTMLLQSQEADEVQRAVVQQQVQTWELLNVLYAAIEDTSEVPVDSTPSFVDMRRREGLSSWLQVKSLLRGGVFVNACAAWLLQW